MGTYLGIWRVLDHFANNFCLTLGIMNSGDSVNLVPGLIRQIWIPPMILLEGLELVIGLDFGDLSRDTIKVISR